MYLIVGLGNPGPKYVGNRHNAGFFIADHLAQRFGMPEFREKFSGLLTRGSIAGESVAILKPLTYMNLSGDSVQPAAAFLKVEVPNIVVLHDELDLPFGEVRLKVGGGHAGHNGLRSLLGRLGSPDFARVRIGIGRPPTDFRGDIADYVLRDFDSLERASLPELIARAGDFIPSILSVGTRETMNRLHPKAPRNKKTPKPAEPPAAPDSPKAPFVESPTRENAGKSSAEER